MGTIIYIVKLYLFPFFQEQTTELVKEDFKKCNHKFVSKVSVPLMGDLFPNVRSHLEPVEEAFSSRRRLLISKEHSIVSRTEILDITHTIPSIFSAIYMQS